MINNNKHCGERSESLMEKLGFTEEHENKNEKESVEPTVQAAFDSTQISNLCKNSLDFLAGIALPNIFKYFFPPVFIAVWKWLLEYVHKLRDFSQLALGLPRGFGKTMVVKLFILYCILFTQKKFILVLCETTAKAKNIIADVADMLDESNIKRAFGDWRIGIETDTQELKKFGFRGRNIILMGAGVESGIRGITIKNARPDVMIFDDIQSRACAESQTQSDTLEREMYGTAMKAKSPEGCLYLFIANMYPTKHSILRKLKSNPNWIKFIAGGIITGPNGPESLWEDLQPLNQLMREFENDLESGHPEIFYAEVLNDENAASNNLIDLSKLPELPRQLGDIPAGNFIVIDPSNDKSNSDAVSIGYFEVHNGYPVLETLIDDRLSPGDTIRKSLQLAIENNCRLIVVESNAYQYSLLYWFRFLCEQMQLTGIEFVDVYSGSVNKASRILSMLKGYAKGEIFVSQDCRAAVHLQITQFNPMKRDNIDGILDLLTYAPKVMELYGEYIVTTNLLAFQDLEAVKVPEFNSPF